MIMAKSSIMEYRDIKLRISYKSAVSKGIRENMRAHGVVIKAQQRVHIQFIRLDLLRSSCRLAMRSHKPISIIIINKGIFASFRVLLKPPMLLQCTLLSQWWSVMILRELLQLPKRMTVNGTSNSMIWKLMNWHLRRR